MPIPQSLKKIGPSFVTATVILGPASVLLCALAGALYRYSLMWVLLLCLAERLFFMEIGVRVGTCIKDRIYTTAGKLWGMPVRLVGGILGFLSVAPYTAGNILGCALAFDLLVGGGVILWGLAFMAVELCIINFRGVYSRLEKIALIFVAVMVLGFASTLAITGFSIGEMFGGFVPGVPRAAAALLALSIFATNNSGYGFIHTYFVKEKKYTRDEAVKAGRLDFILSSVVITAILALIMMVSAEVLNPAHVVPSGAPEAALMLEPLAGPFARYLFAIGLFGAAFTSLAIQPISTALVLGDGLGHAGFGVEQKFVKIVASLMVIGLGLFGVVPVALGVAAIDIFWIAALMTLIVNPYSGIIMIFLSRRKDILGNLAISNKRTIVAVILYLAITSFIIASVLIRLGVI